MYQIIVTNLWHWCTTSMASAILRSKQTVDVVNIIHQKTTSATSTWRTSRPRHRSASYKCM